MVGVSRSFFRENLKSKTRNALLHSENSGICLKKNKLKTILEIECECYRE